VYSGHRLLDGVIEPSTAVLFYGPAGAGKTTLLLAIASNVCRFHDCVYISTEETLHYERVAKNPEKYEKALFAEAYDMDTLLRLAIATYLLRPVFVFVDSINALFRVEALRESALTKQVFIISLLLEAVAGHRGKLFATAQVRVGERGDLEASGSRIMDYYFDTVIGVFTEEAGRRYIKPAKTPVPASFNKLSFKITETGVEWLD